MRNTWSDTGLNCITSKPNKFNLCAPFSSFFNVFVSFKFISYRLSYFQGLRHLFWEGGVLPLRGLVINIWKLTFKLRPTSERSVPWGWTKPIISSRSTRCSISTATANTWIILTANRRSFSKETRMRMKWSSTFSSLRSARRRSSEFFPPKWKARRSVWGWSWRAARSWCSISVSKIPFQLNTNCTRGFLCTNFFFVVQIHKVPFEIC